MTKPTKPTVIKLRKFIEDSFAKHQGDSKVRMFRDIRTNHARRAFKSGSAKQRNVWKCVLEDLDDLGIEGFELYAPSSDDCLLNSGIVRKELI